MDQPEALVQPEITGPQAQLGVREEQEVPVQQDQQEPVVLPGPVDLRVLRGQMALQAQLGLRALPALPVQLVQPEPRELPELPDQQGVQVLLALPAKQGPPDQPDLPAAK